MQTIKNESAAPFHLPSKTSADGEEFGQGVMLAAGASLPVPGWYLDALMDEKGWRKRLGPGGVIAKRVKEDPTEAKLRQEASKVRDRADGLERDLAACRDELTTVKRTSREKYEAVMTEAKASREALVEGHKAAIAKLEETIAGLTPPPAAEGEEPAEGAPAAKRRHR